MIIEGAGSPAEINLRKGDFVNMGLAHASMLGCPHQISIERCLPHSTARNPSMKDRSRIMGFIINKFRGDVTLLTPAISARRWALRVSVYCRIRAEP